MQIIKFFTACFFLLIFLSVAQDAQDATVPVNKKNPLLILSEGMKIKQDSKGDTAILEGDIFIQYQDMTLTADYAEFNKDTTDILLKGNIVIIRPEGKWMGREASGNIKLKTFNFDRYKIIREPFYLDAQKTKRDKDGISQLEKGRLTTCDYLINKQPHWHLQAHSMMLKPDGHFHAKHVTLRLFNIPIFYFPALSGNINWNPDVEFAQGDKSDWGYWVRLGKRFKHGEHMEARYYIEHRAERGFAFGDEFTYQKGPFLSRTHLYGMKDIDPIYEYQVGNKEYNDRFETEKERFRIDSYNQFDFTDDLSMRLKLDYSSDHNFLYEFYRDDYNANPEPASFADLTYFNSRFELSLNVSPRVNDFYTAVERLPELILKIPPQQIGKSKLYFQSVNTLSQLRMNFREFDIDRPIADNMNYESGRFDSTNVIYFPMKAGWLNLLPRAGIRFTAYENTSETAVTDAQINANIEADDDDVFIANPAIASAYDELGGSQSRTAVELGLEANFSIYGTHPDFRVEKLKINGLKHQIKPYINYTYINEPDLDKENIYFFDEIDRLDEVNHLRVGVKQHFFTRSKENQSYEIMSLNLFYDYYMNNEHQKNHPGDLGAIFKYRINDYFNVWAKELYDLDVERHKAFLAGANLEIEDGINFYLSYIDVKEHNENYYYSFGSDHDRIYSSSVFTGPRDASRGLGIRTFFPLTEDLSFQTSHYWDLLNDELGRESYTLAKRLHCWVAALTYSRNDEDNRIELTFFLKGFPGVSVNHSSDIGNSTVE